MRIKPFFLNSGTAGEGSHSGQHPNNVRRPGGTSTCLLEYTLGGMGMVRNGDSSWDLVAGSFLLYEACVPQHYTVHPDTKRWDHIWFSFDPRPHWEDWTNWPEISPGISMTHVESDWQQGRVINIMREGINIARSVHVHRRNLVLNVLERTLLTIDAWNPMGRKVIKDDRIHTVLEFIQEHAFEKLTIPDLARVCSLSCSRFSHLFQEEIGQSPMQYIEERRIGRAKELLMTTSRPVSQIAEECGFSNPLYFSRVFKARTGLAPRVARQRSKD